jgi:hypothetical protein
MKNIANNYKPISSSNNIDLHQIHMFDNRFTKIVQAGHTTTANATLSDLNDSGNANWIMPATATTLTIVSSDAADAFPVGAGLTLLLIQGLDQNLNEIEEVVFMAGLTPAVTIQSFRAMNVSIALAGGTPGSGSVGVITISATTGGQVFGKYIINDTTCEVGRYTIPNGKKMIGLALMINGGKGSDMTLKSEFTLNIPGSHPISLGETYPSEGFYNWESVVNFFLNPGDTFKTRVKYNSGGSGVRYISVIFTGMIATIEAWDSIGYKN